MCERGFRQHVVSQSVREAREGVRGQRRDDEDVPALEMRIRIVGRSRSRERVEGLGGDEPLCAGGEHRVHVVAGANEKADECAGLVGRNPAGHSEQDARHAPLPQLEGASCLIFPFATSSMAIVR